VAVEPVVSQQVLLPTALLKIKKRGNYCTENSKPKYWDSKSILSFLFISVQSVARGTDQVDCMI
jgi:hypothetical protein